MFQRSIMMLMAFVAALLSFVPAGLAAAGPALSPGCTWVNRPANDAIYSYIDPQTFPFNAGEQITIHTDYPTTFAVPTRTVFRFNGTTLYAGFPGDLVYRIPTTGPGLFSWSVDMPLGNVTWTVTCAFVGVPPLTTADLGITIMATNPTPRQGEVFNYVMTYSNPGPDTATGVLIATGLPSAVTLQSANGNGSYNAATGIWTIGTLIRGQNATISFQVKVKSGTAGKIFDASADISGTSFDPNLANNHAATRIKVRHG